MDAKQMCLFLAFLCLLLVGSGCDDMIDDPAVTNAQLPDAAVRTNPDSETSLTAGCCELAPEEILFKDDPVASACWDAVSGIYCDLGAPVIHDGMVFSRMEAFEACAAGTDSVWSDIVDCYNQHGLGYYFVDCLAQRGWPPLGTGVFDLSDPWQVQNQALIPEGLPILPGSTAQALNFWAFRVYDNQIFIILNGEFFGATVSLSGPDFILVQHLDQEVFFMVGIVIDSAGKSVYYSPNRILFLEQGELSVWDTFGVETYPYAGFTLLKQ